MKDILFKILKPLFSLLPKRLVFRLFSGSLTLYARSQKPDEGLRFLFRLDRHIYGLQASIASAHNGGVHPKHRLMKYHDFFVQRISPGETVLDIGCGIGSVAFDIAEKTGVFITAIDFSEKNIRIANEKNLHPNITYIYGDALRDLPVEHYDVIVLSNVLEHIDDRLGFLRQVREHCSPIKWLIRVPLFERDWRVPLMKELGAEWRLDDTHFTEYSIESFREEMALADLHIQYFECRWGEIWSEIH